MKISIELIEPDDGYLTYNISEEDAGLIAKYIKDKDEEGLRVFFIELGVKNNFNLTLDMIESFAVSV